LSLVPLCGCAVDSSPWVEVGGQRFSVEVAADPESRTRGLMFRDSLDPNRGMLFVFEREEPLAFWMKNTRIPLDILYFDAEQRFVSMASGVPPCTTAQCPTYPSAGPARFTLELKAGVGKELRLQAGDKMALAPSIAVTPKLD
jgi:uncharacterized membrane protein (UPF0127 family)